MYAYDIELLLHNRLISEKAYGPYSFAANFGDLSKHPFFGDGQTELYRNDVLGLDPNYKKPFSIFGIFKGSNSDLVNRRKLSMAVIIPAEREQAAKHVYKILDSFLKPPFFESKKEFIEKRGDWVVSLQRWAIRNGLGSHHDCGLDDGITVHGGKTLPSTESELLKMKKLIPVWAYTDSIPNEIAYLKNLEVVSFPFDTIESIPKGLYTLKNLKVLDLTYSSITSISSDIKNLVSLEVLCIKKCPKITRLPIEIESLPNLKEIIISKDAYPILKDSLPNKSHLLTYDAPWGPGRWDKW